MTDDEMGASCKHGPDLEQYIRLKCAKPWAIDVADMSVW